MKRFAALMATAFIFLAAMAGSALAEERAVLASTTSTENTGLFGALLPAYYGWTKLGDVRIDVVAVGTGKALEIARRGDADILLVHDRDREEAFVAEGYGVDRREVMFNDFLIIGPHADPAGVSDATTATLAFLLISEKGAPFVSRGDDSGTHSREKKLWKSAGVDVSSLKNYYSVGQGMEATLRVADEKAAYTLTDRASFNTVRASLRNIGPMFQGDPLLYNQYAVIAINPEKFPHVRYDIAEDFINFITGPEGQKLIGEFRDAHGGMLFVPNAAK